MTVDVCVGVAVNDAVGLAGGVGDGGADVQPAASNARMMMDERRRGNMGEPPWGV